MGGEAPQDGVDAVLAGVVRHCTASAGGSFLPGPVRARLFAAAVASFSHEGWAAPQAPPGGEAALDTLLRGVAHRIIRRQFSLDARWYAETKQALARCLSLPDDDAQLEGEAALAEVFLVVALAACVYTRWLALEGPAAATERCKGALSGAPDFVSTEQWARLRGLSPRRLAAANAPLFAPYGTGDNAQKGGNRMHALQAPVPGDLLPPGVQQYFGAVNGMPGGAKAFAMRACTLAPGDMEAFLQAMEALYMPISKMLSFSKLPGRELSRSELECVADATAATLACSF